MSREQAADDGVPCAASCRAAAVPSTHGTPRAAQRLVHLPCQLSPSMRVDLREFDLRAGQRVELRIIEVKAGALGALQVGGDRREGGGEGGAAAVLLQQTYLKQTQEQSFWHQWIACSGMIQSAARAGSPGETAPGKPPLA